MVSLSEGGDVEWNKREIGNWMKKAQQLNASLLFLLHIGSGQPACGTEITTVLFCNQQHIHRSLFALPGGLVTIIGYNKVGFNPLSFSYPLTHILYRQTQHLYKQGSFLASFLPSSVSSSST